MLAPHLVLLFAAFLFVSEVTYSLPVIHVVPHSHCDAGYRESFQEYYDKQVHSILDTMLIALNTSTSRKFVWEESSFLQYWWVNDATDAQKSLMKQLITDKRLEMIGGGWTMHDEAANNVPTILSQMALGLKFLNDSLNIRPKHEWHIDPFGHSIMMPELYSALQYDAIVINRIPDDIKQQMRKNQHLEFMWTSSLTGASMFTHVLDMHYSTPSIHGNTTDQRASYLAYLCNLRLKWYRTDNLLLPFGGDFNFEDATKQFLEMEELMSYINQNQDKFHISMQFSTLNDYFTHVKAFTSPNDFPEIRDRDFFPYIACYPCFSSVCGGFNGSYVPCGIQTPDGYWSGYYTSKPAQKLVAYEQESSLTVLDRLNSLYPVLYDEMFNLQAFYEVQALMTHHDAITGTSFPPAYDDYSKRLNISLSSQREYTGAIMSLILCGPDYKGLFTNNSVELLKVLSDNGVAMFTVFNPLFEQRSEYARIQVPKGLCFKVSSTTDKDIQFQQVESTVYVAMSLGPLEMGTLIVSKTDCSSRYNKGPLKDTVIDNGYLKLLFDDDNRITSLMNTKLDKKIDFSLRFNEMLEKEASYTEIPHSVCDGSNVYTYVPDEGVKPLTPINTKIDTLVTASGPLVWEVHQTIFTKNSSNPISMKIRLFKPIGDDEFFMKFIEVQNTVGPLDSGYPNSVLFSVSTSLDTKDYFTTYTSGLYPMERRYNQSKSIQGNNYPLVGRVSMKDDKQDIGVVISTKRPMAVTSREGALDLLVHRRIIIDGDPRGNDSSVLADPVYVGLTKTDDINEASYTAMSYSHSPFTVYGSIIPSLPDWYKQCDSIYTPLHQSLPRTVKLLGMEVIEPPLKGTTQYRVGLRLVNIGDESSSVNLFTLFTSSYKVLSVVESTPDYLIQLNTLDYNQTWKLPPYKLASAIITFIFI